MRNGWSLVAALCSISSEGGITSLLFSYLMKLTAVCAAAILLMGLADKISSPQRASAPMLAAIEDLRDSVKSR